MQSTAASSPAGSASSTLPGTRLVSRSGLRRLATGLARGAGDAIVQWRNAPPQHVDADTAADEAILQGDDLEDLVLVCAVVILVGVGP